MTIGDDMTDGCRQADWGNPAFRRQYQRDYRKELKAQGYRRLDAWIAPKLWEALYPLMDPSFRDTHPNAAIIDLLERVNT